MPAQNYPGGQLYSQEELSELVMNLTSSYLNLLSIVEKQAKHIEQLVYLNRAQQKRIAALEGRDKN